MKKTNKLRKKLLTKPETIRTLVDLAKVSGGALSSDPTNERSCGPSYALSCP